MGLLDSYNGYFEDPRVLGLLGLSAGMLTAGDKGASTGGALGQGMLGGIQGYKSGIDMMNDHEKLRILRERAAQEMNGGSPYFQFLPTANGYAVGDARKGTITQPGEGGLPVLMRGADDPYLQGQIARQREGNAAAAKSPYEFVDTVGPGGERFATPKSAIVGRQVPTMPGGAVKTEMSPYEKTSMESTAKADVERGAEADKKARSVSNLDAMIEEARTLLNENPTDSWIEGKRDDVNRLIGRTTKPAQTAAKLETLSGWMTSNVPRMEGPQSNYDVENYRTMAAKVGDRNIPIKERQAAIDALESIQKKYSQTNQQYRAGGSANSAPTAQQYTEEDLQHTAFKYGITVEQVKQRLGVK